ncbi:pyruvate kinase [Raphidocelis subcapitata]|uniref:Pyruvate kinase n=1 Tax=Raphidocelis subcapitata TaxID=307507 RepID=A0A2V0NJQ1_9CHLO|nr:pyruvate kinase [Raphidocelis subcapitata]|eukprot:GBF87464.1 pyruvate kinase [Raphidocelis subcapitata]
MKTKAHFFPDLNLGTILEPAVHDTRHSATKVVATIGPSCQSVDMLVKLLEDGMSAARVDLTWGPIEYHRRSLDNLQEAMRRTRKLCAIMLDTLGREVMIRRPFRIDDDGWPTQAGQEIEVKAGQRLTLTTRDLDCTSTELPVTYPRFADMAEPGDDIYLGRYLVSGADTASLYLKVEDVVGGTDVICTAQNGALLDGLLTVFHVERSSDSLENMQNDQPLLSDYDKECLASLGQTYEIDFVSLSYTRSSEDVLEAREFLDSVGLGATKIFAKLESRQSLLNFKGTLNAADGVIISRGNLGLDCLPEKMALIQKSLIQTCNLVGKPVLITRVMDTMAVTPRPTRAEATDVANAVLDGVDGFLLGQETLRGGYPREAVQTITLISKQAEKVFDHHYHFDHLMDTAQEEDVWDPPGTTPPGAASPLEGSSGDLQTLDGANSLATEPTQLTLATGNGHAAAQPKRSMHRTHSSESFSSLTLAVKAMTRFGPSSRIGLDGMNHSDSAQQLYQGSPYLSKIDSIASSAVRAADKVKASLIVVYTHTGRTAQLVAKYRPPMPILTLVVPRLVSDSLHWRLEGRHNARQCMLTRGLLPILATPSPSGDAILDEAVACAARMGIVHPQDHVVAVQRVHADYCVKIISVDAGGCAIEAMPFDKLQEESRRSIRGGASDAAAAAAVFKLAPNGEVEGEDGAFVKTASFK